MGSPWTDLTRAPGGRVMCCICFEWRTRDELFQDRRGKTWDTCDGQCALEAGIAKPGLREQLETERDLLVRIYGPVAAHEFMHSLAALDRWGDDGGA